MKTLLLTLVVVTIVCLDLGYTKTCYKYDTLFGKTTETCADGQNICFKRWHMLVPGRYHVSRGCAATCPKAQNHDSVECCAKENCNA
uniref:Three-finger toxin 12 n=1 Tax=Micrurus fulvius TaxID=8637 RepID=U3EPM9_MICFL